MIMTAMSLRGAFAFASESAAIGITESQGRGEEDQSGVQLLRSFSSGRFTASPDPPPFRASPKVRFASLVPFCHITDKFNAL